MYINSQYARTGRNFSREIVNGDIEINNNGSDSTDYRYTIKDSEIVEVVIKPMGSWSNRIEIEYGVEERRYKDNKLVERIDYKEGSNRAKSSSYYSAKAGINVIYADFQYPTIKQSIKIVNFMRGKYTHNLVVYRKGTRRVLLKAYSGQKELKMYHPNGKLFLHLNSKYSMANLYLYLCEGRIEWSKIEGNPFDDIATIQRLMSSLALKDSYRVSIYNTDGTIRTQFSVESRQIDGEGKLNNKDIWYVGGVPLNKEHYLAKPEDIDPSCILEEPNAQVRSVLIKKIGLERMLQKCKADIVHTSGEYKLFDIAIPAQERANNAGLPRRDAHIRLLKVVCPSTGTFYTLRVPPTIDTCEEARAWTFGIDADANGKITQEMMLQFKEET